LIAVDDHDKALAFYRDILGLEVRNDVGFDGMRWVTVGSPSQPGVDIVLEPPTPTGRRGRKPRGATSTRTDRRGRHR
jgi:catechol 2,3-dioxygenase-like lactoylglutathione lyase family enzyme